MSEPIDHLRAWRFYLDDMIEFAQKVRDYTRGLDPADFPTSGITYDATLRNLELIGEAATHIPDAVRNAHPEIPWRMVIATRNRLIHGCLGIDDDIVWSIIQDDIPELLNTLRAFARCRTLSHEWTRMKTDRSFVAALVIVSATVGVSPCLSVGWADVGGPTIQGL